eukprot:1346143-Amphidinium_carterae.1
MSMMEQMKSFKVQASDLDIVKNTLHKDRIGIEDMIRSSASSTLEAIEETNKKHKKYGYTQTVAGAFL